MKNYVTFGQVHVHEVSGITFDRNCVATYESDTKEDGRNFAFSIFGDKFCFHYVEPDIPDMSYFPRGLIDLFVD